MRDFKYCIFKYLFYSNCMIRKDTNIWSIKKEKLKQSASWVCNRQVDISKCSAQYTVSLVSLWKWNIFPFFWIESSILHIIPPHSQGNKLLLLLKIVNAYCKQFFISSTKTFKYKYFLKVFYYSKLQRRNWLWNSSKMSVNSVWL